LVKSSALQPVRNEQEALPRIFGGVGQTQVRGMIAKQRLIAKRTGDTSLQDAGCTVLTPRDPNNGVAEFKFQQGGGKKTFPNAPNMKSMVDEAYSWQLRPLGPLKIVFGVDIDFSGEDQFDEEFMHLYGRAAGISSTEMSRARGLRTYDSAPGQQSIVDQVVFGRDMDFSRENQHDEDFLSMYTDRAGKPSNGSAVPRNRVD
ncbi:unnamed protein product, partial [Polarella glacialis]